MACPTGKSRAIPPDSSQRKDEPDPEINHAQTKGANPPCDNTLLCRFVMKQGIWRYNPGFNRFDPGTPLRSGRKEHPGGPLIWLQDWAWQIARCHREDFTRVCAGLFRRRDRRQDCYRAVIFLTELAPKGRRGSKFCCCAPGLRTNQPNSTSPTHVLDGSCHDEALAGLPDRIAWLRASGESSRSDW